MEPAIGPGIAAGHAAQVLTHHGLEGPPGRQFASLLGRELAAAGVAVVSGLARGIDAAAHLGALAAALNRPEGPTNHLVLANKVYLDNRIPPRGFTNLKFAAIQAEPVAYSYADGQYWDDTVYALPPGATRAEVKLYYQSTSKEFVEFLRDENRTTTHGQTMYDLWNNNGKCPPTLIAEKAWVTAFAMKSGSTRTPFSCSAVSAAGAIGMLAPSSTSRVLSRWTLSSRTTSGRAAGTT